MKQLKGIIRDMNMSHEEVARALFQGNKYPTLALSRVEKGLGSLTIPQLVELSNLSGLTLDQIVQPSKADWSAKLERGSITLEQGGFIVKINYSSGNCSIYSMEKQEGEMFKIDPELPLTEFINQINIRKWKLN